MHTDPTHIDPVPTIREDRNTDPRRRRAAIALAIVLLAGALTTAGMVVGSHTAPAPTGAALDAASSSDDRGWSTATEDVVVTDVVAESDQSGGGGVPSGGVELDEGGAVPAGPCDALEGDRALVVGPAPLVLENDDMAGFLVIRNCSDASVDWTAATAAPQVELQSPAGTLAGGAEVDLQFAVDEGAIGPGAFTFTVTVGEPGGDTEVDVHVFNSTLAIPQVPGIGYTAAPGSGGCSLQCITRAWLTPQAANTDLALEIETTVPASLRVWVSTGMPVLLGGTPSFPGVTSPIAAHDGLVDGWTTTLSGLEPATTYNIIVRATDENGKQAHRVGSFTTVTPVPAGVGFAPNEDVGGCAVQCIDGAALTPIDGTSDVSIDVSTVVPAAIDVFVGTSAPGARPDGSPTFGPDVEPIASTGGALATAFVADLTGLAGGTEHHIVVEAVDADGRRSYRVGSFHTEQHLSTVVVGFHRIHVDFDGDKGVNRGELRFRLGVGGQMVAELGERKVSSGTSIGLSDGDRVPGIGHVVEGVGDVLPVLAVQGIERDWDAHGEFCTETDLMMAALNGFSDSCDWSWNTASTGIQFVDDIGDLLPCPSLGIGGMPPEARCQEIHTPDLGSGYARFRAVVSFTVVDE